MSDEFTVNSLYLKVLSLINQLNFVRSVYGRVLRRVYVQVFNYILFA